MHQYRKEKDKTVIFIEQVHKLAVMMLLIQRNSKMHRPSNATSLPSMFIGYKKGDEGSITQEFSGHELKLTSKQKPLFFSFHDVLECINFTIEDEINVLLSKEETYQIGLRYRSLCLVNEKETHIGENEFNDFNLFDVCI